MKRTILLATTILLTPAALAGQSADAAADARIRAAVHSAAEAGIPAHLLESKAAEGRAKGVADARIASAVEARLDALMRARALIDEAGASGRTHATIGLRKAGEAAGDAGAEGRARADAAVDATAQAGAEGRARAASAIDAATEVTSTVAAGAEGTARTGGAQGQARGHATADVALLVATADALQANVDGQALLKVWSEAPAENRALATATTTQLVRLGHGGLDAAAQVTSALRTGAGALTELSARAGAQLEARGLTDGVSAAARGHGHGALHLRR